MRNGRALSYGILLFCGLVAAAPPTWAAGSLIISEFRVRGPSGANDEFIEIYNDNASVHTVSAISGTGYAVAASDGATRCTIPNATVIPAHGHFLCVNSTAFSLGTYPAGSGTIGTGDATYATDIPDNAGIALFNNNTGGGSFSLANRFDAVGSTSEANTLYKEGTGYPALTPFSIDYSFVRDACGKNGAVNDLTPCTRTGDPKDTDDNAADFYFVDTNGTSAGAGQRLGAPGPESLASPISGTGLIPNTRLDTCMVAGAAPNLVRDITSDPANNSTFGTLDIRRTFTNNTGAPLTRLRFRIIDLGTFPASSGFADLRPRTSSSVVVAVDGPTCDATTSNVTVAGTTLEQNPAQPNGGGFNSSMGAGGVTLATPLANGASIDLRFLMGIQQTGFYRVAFIVEALPKGGGSSDTFTVSGHTNAPTVSSIVRADASPSAAASVAYTVTFSESVTGVDATDFAWTTTGAVAGVSIASVTGSGATYTVTVNTGTGDGTIRLDVADDDTIVNGSATKLGSPGVGNGDFSSGEVYTIAKGSVPTVASIVRADANPTSAGSVAYTVTFSESVTGVDATDFALTSTVPFLGASIAGVTGSGATYTVTVNTGHAPGTIRLDVVDNDSIVDGSANSLGGPGTGNGNFSSGEVYTITMSGGGALPPSLLILGLALSLFRLRQRRRTLA